MPDASNLKTAVLELRDVFAQHLPAADVPGVLRKAVEKALAEVLGDAPKRRGRPSKNETATPASARGPKRKGRSSASREKQAAKMRAYWKARKAAEGGNRKHWRPAKTAVGTAEAT
jgi:hypothetical protein